MAALRYRKLLEKQAPDYLIGGTHATYCLQTSRVVDDRNGNLDDWNTGCPRPGYYAGEQTLPG